MTTLLEKHRDELTDSQLDHFIAHTRRILEEKHRLLDALEAERDERGIPAANLFEAVPP